MRELEWAGEARLDHEWAMNSMLVAAVMNATPGRKKAVSPDEVNPMVLARRAPERSAPAVPIGDLRDAITGPGGLPVRRRSS